mgnify:FL=1
MKKMRGDETEMYYPRTHSQDRREQMADDREERMEALRERVRAKKEAALNDGVIEEELVVTTADIESSGTGQNPSHPDLSLIHI